MVENATKYHETIAGNGHVFITAEFTHLATTVVARFVTVTLLPDSKTTERATHEKEVNDADSKPACNV